MNEELLICTNGHEASWPAIEYGAWVASTLDAAVTLLGVAERLPAAPIDAKHPLEEVFARAVELFEQQGVHYSLEVQNGEAEEVLPREARKANRIVVVGRLARPAFRRLLSGRSIHHLLANIPCPVLYVPRARIPVRTMLVCMGGLGYEINAEQLAIRLGAKTQAQMTLLHVAPPVDLDYPTARAERQHWRDLEKTDSVIGRHLRQAIDKARAAGLTAGVKARQGNVVEEILAEIREGNYDLVCMGSQYSGHGLRPLYGPSVTDEVAERASCPILTARYAKA
jgi:nucleotide-binding universal stress UspA family protein